MGRHLCRDLVNAGHEVVAFLRQPDIDAPGANCATRTVAGDILDRASVDRALREHGAVDAICHLATEPPGDGPRSGANTVGTRVVLAAAVDAGVGRLVFTSTMSVHDFLDPELPEPVPEDHRPSPRDAYGREKLEAEGDCLRAAERNDLRVCVLRLAGVYGPGKRAGAVYNFCRAVLTGRPLDIAVNRSVDLLWVEDAARAVRLAAEVMPTDTLLHIGSGVATPLDEVARQAAQISGRDADIRVGASGNAFCLDIARARHHLAFQPTPLADALERFLPTIAAESDLGDRL